MDLNPKIPKDCLCKPLLRSILRDLKGNYKNAIEAGLVSNAMLVLMVKALAWEHLGRSAVLLQCGQHIEPAVEWLADAVCRDL